MARYKTGYRANDTDRAIAARWAALYRQAQQSPDKCVCVNPEDEREEQTSLYADDVDMLLALLEGFAETGTFQHTDRYGFDGWVLSWQFQRMRREGMGYTEALHALAEKHHCSTRSIERRLPTNRDTDCR